FPRVAGRPRAAAAGPAAAEVVVGAESGLSRSEAGNRHRRARDKTLHRKHPFSNGTRSASAEIAAAITNQIRIYSTRTRSDAARGYFTSATDTQQRTLRTKSSLSWMRGPNYRTQRKDQLNSAHFPEIHAICLANAGKVFGLSQMRPRDR